MKIIKRTDSATYGVNDVVSIVEDNHLFSPAELNTNVFTIEENVTLSQSDINKLLMNDDMITIYSAISQLPTFRSLSTSFKNAELLHKRKYQYINGVIELKSNAQVLDNG